MASPSYRQLQRRRPQAAAAPAAVPPAALVKEAPALGDRALRRVKRLVAVLVLYPLVGVSVISSVEFVYRLVTRTGFWKSEPLLFFGWGCLCWALLQRAGLRLVRIYVFGHEMSHLLAAKLFGGRIFGFSVTSEGGFVDTDKSNTWITLAPYLLPFYSSLLALHFALLGMVVDWHRRIEITQTLGLRPALLVYWSLGFTWWFHVCSTARALRVAQTDLQRNGEFFSLSVIVLCNLAVLLALYLGTSSSPLYEFKEWIRLWWGTARWLVGLLSW